MSEYSIEKYLPEDKNEIVDLQKYHWGPDKRLNEAYLEWKYDRNPNNEGTSIYLARQSERVVGMVGMCGASWECGEQRETFTAPLIADAIVIPEHRGNGLFRKLIATQFRELESSGIRHSFALSVGTLSYPILLQTGWRSIGPVGTSLKVNDPARKNSSGFLYSASRKLGSAFGSMMKAGVFDAFDREAAKNPRHIAQRVTMEKKARPEAMADLIERIPYDGRIRHVRDAQYLSWRFENPFSKFRFLFWQDKTLEGYLVLQASIHNSKRRAEIIDWEATNAEVQKDLLQAAILTSKDMELRIWAATLCDNSKKMLQSEGFRSAPTTGNADSPVLIRPVYEHVQEQHWRIENHSLLEWKDWDLRWLYSDHCG